MAATESVETNYLIVGAGPAGAALACFLAEYGERDTDFLKLLLADRNSCQALPAS